MKQPRKSKEVSLSFNYSTTPARSEIHGIFITVPQNYRTTPVGPEPPKESKTSADSERVYLRILEIEDPRFEETYTAYVTRTPSGWSGRIPDIPEIDKCEASTPKALLESLKDNLYEVLKTRSDAWDRQIEDDVKAGRLDHLREEALEEIKAGRAIDL